MTTCICCGGRESQAAFIKSGFEIRRCSTCGLGRTVWSVTLPQK